MNSSAIRSPNTATRVRRTRRRARAGGRRRSRSRRATGVADVGSRLLQNPGTAPHQVVGHCARRHGPPPFVAVAVARPHRARRARRPPARPRRRASGRRRRTSAPDRGRARPPPAAAGRAAACGSRTPRGTPRPSRRDGADSNRTRRSRAPPASSASASAGASPRRTLRRRSPRAMPAWLVITTTTKPARLSSRTASTLNGKKREALEPIEIARLLR